MRPTHAFPPCGSPGVRVTHIGGVHWLSPKGPAHSPALDLQLGFSGITHCLPQAMMNGAHPGLTPDYQERPQLETSGLVFATGF
ncbi:hypothetical protein MC885_009867 [Smutsia gigantea]|nr:hypothetical protein MC885_009867 [Smutsia gigantea]